MDGCASPMRFGAAPVYACCMSGTAMISVAESKRDTESCAPTAPTDAAAASPAPAPAGAPSTRLSPLSRPSSAVTTAL